LNTQTGFKLIKGEPALLAGETLVIADTHIGYEGEIRLKGIKLPSLTRSILTRILNLAEKTSATRLLILGDLKHTVYGPRGLEWMEIPEFMRRIATRFEWVGVVPGNHDGDLYTVLPEEVELMDSDGVLLNGILFTHGHKRIDNVLDKKGWSNVRKIVVGHFHPAVELLDDLGYRYVIPVWIRGLLKNSVEIFFMPAFNKNIGKLIVNNPKRMSDELKGFLKTGSINLKEAEAYSLDLVLIGRIGEIET
jgi:putative SbcD/Mre11-related phosphoesterase